MKGDPALKALKGSSAPGLLLVVTGIEAVATITIRAAAQMRPDCPREVLGSFGLSQVDESSRGATGVANPDLRVVVSGVRVASPESCRKP